MYIKARVAAGARIDRLTQTSKDHFEISVKEKAERNLANMKVIELVACHYSIPKGKVRIVTGHHSASKIMSIEVS